MKTQAKLGTNLRRSSLGTMLRVLPAVLVLGLAMLPAVAQGEAIVPHKATPANVTPHIVTPPPAVSPPPESPAAESPPPADIPAVTSPPPTDGTATDGSPDIASPAAPDSPVGDSPESGPVAGCSPWYNCPRPDPKAFYEKLKEHQAEIERQRAVLRDIVSTGEKMAGVIICPFFRGAADQLGGQWIFWSQATQEQLGIPTALKNAIYLSYVGDYSVARAGVERFCFNTRDE